MIRKKLKFFGILIVFLLLLVSSIGLLISFAGASESIIDNETHHFNKVFLEAFFNAFRDRCNDDKVEIYGYGPEWNTKDAIEALDYHVTEGRSSNDNLEEYIKNLGDDFKPYFDSYFPGFDRIFSEAMVTYLNYRGTEWDCETSGSCDTDLPGCTGDEDFGPEWSPDDVLSRLDCHEMNPMNYYVYALTLENPSIKYLMRAHMMGERFEKEYKDFIIDFYNNENYFDNGGYNPPRDGEASRFGPEWDLEEYEAFLESENTSVYGRYARFLYYKYEQGGDDERVDKILNAAHDIHSP